MTDIRTVEVECTWRSYHTIEIPADADRIEPNDISTLITYEDVDSSISELVDWDIQDKGPQA